MNLVQLLTNENQIILSFFKLLVSIIQSLLFYELFMSVLKISYNRKQKIQFISSFTIIGFIVNFIPNPLITDILNLLVFLLSMHYIFHQTIKRSFLAMIFSYIGVIVSGSISELIFMFIFNVKLTEITSVPIYYALSCFLSFSFFYLLIILVKKLNTNTKSKRTHKLPLKAIVIFNLLFGLLTILIESYLTALYIGLIPMRLTMVSIITLLIYFSISIYSILRTNSLEKTQSDLENEILYNKTLTLLHDNIRCFKHDFNNIVQAIGGYIELNDMDGLREYYKRLLEECKITNNLNILNPETINNPSIYSLLTNKYYIANQKDIKMTFSIFTDLSNINFNSYELSRILGILLDNAIEAAEETPEKLIDIEFVSDNKKQLFIIRNSCKDSNISTTKIFEKGYSTKERNSGIGLWKVHKILSKNTNVDLFTTVQNNMFSQQLEVFYE